MNIHGGDLSALETEDVGVAVVHHLGEAQRLHDDHDALAVGPFTLLQRQLGNRLCGAERRPPSGEGRHCRTVALVFQTEFFGRLHLEVDRAGRLVDPDLIPEPAGDGVDGDAAGFECQEQRVGGFVSAKEDAGVH